MKRCNVAAIPAVVGFAPDGTPDVLVAGAEPTVDQLVAFLARAKQRLAINRATARSAATR
jgi:hypothetical protein